MPARNSIKQYDVDAYYHVYNRGVNKRSIFLDAQDYGVFMGMLKRYLGSNAEKDAYNRNYPNYGQGVDLLAFCLMPNHFHLLLYQKDDIKAMELLMRSLTTAYTRYFNSKYKRTGHLFQGSYKASRILSDPYLLHISRYIHMNPKDYKSWPYSSWPYFTQGWNADWLNHHKIFELFEGGNYEQFVDSYQQNKEDQEALKNLLADK